MILNLYKSLMGLSAPALTQLLQWRKKKGKEDKVRWLEKTGIASRDRPSGNLIWLHAASVGEAQSGLILIERITKQLPDSYILVTTGTRTSAEMMDKRLPDHAFHQFMPLDHPEWVKRFLTHWQPDLVLWTESELWPNMLHLIKSRGIPAVLINGRLSERSGKAWSYVKSEAQDILATFSLILAQTEEDAARFRLLGAGNVEVTGNLKYSAAPLPVDEEDLTKLQTAIGGRPIWLYASTHAGEETLALRLHQRLIHRFPDLLTIIVPRHPDRGDAIAELLGGPDVSVTCRGSEKYLPQDDTNIYIADTLGEMGLFYRLSPVAVIGRSFSDDGGGGHNPIEAAQLDCAVLHGPNVQFQKEIFRAMHREEAAIEVKDRYEFYDALYRLLDDPDALTEQRKRARDFAGHNSRIIDTVMSALTPMLKPFAHMKDAS